MALDSVVKYDFSPSELVVIRNHPGGYFYKADASSRFFYYPETYAEGQGYAHWMPTVWFNGMDEQTGAWTNVYTTWSVYHDKIVNWLFIPSPLVIDLQVEYGEKADTGMVHVQVIAEDTICFSDLHLRIALTEDDITYSMKHYDQILRDYLPIPDGIFFTIAQGDTFTHSEPFVIESSWNAANCNLVAFVQNDAERMVVQCVQESLLNPILSPQVAVNYPNGGEALLDSVTITWTAIDPNYGETELLLMDLYYSEDAGASWSVIDSMQPNDGNYFWDISGLSDGEDYLIRIKATDTTGMFDSDSSDGVFLIDANPPETVENLTAQLHAGMKSYGGNIHLSWSEPFDIVGIHHYVIYRSDSPQELGESLAMTSDTTYIDEYVYSIGKPNLNYYYTVKAVDFSGNKSDPSNQVGECDKVLRW